MCVCVCVLVRVIAGGPGARSSCALSAHYRVEAFDSTFGTAYREHMFRYNALVPASLRLDWTTEPEFTRGNGGGAIPTYFVRPEHANFDGTRGRAIGNKDGTLTAEALRRDTDTTAPLIRFSALYDVRVVLDGADDANFEARWRDAIKPSTVRQY